MALWSHHKTGIKTDNNDPQDVAGAVDLTK